MKKKKAFKKKGKGHNPSIRLAENNGSEDDVKVIQEAQIPAEEAEEVMTETVEDIAVCEPEVPAEVPADLPSGDDEIMEPEEVQEPEVPETAAPAEPEQPAETAEVIVETAEDKTTEETPDTLEKPEAVTPAGHTEAPVEDTEPSVRPGHGYWIHHKVKAAGSMSGYYYLSTCDCSVCGFTANMEKKVCHSCGAIMDLKAPEESI